MGAMRNPAAVGFTWPRGAPVAYAGAAGEATGGEDARFTSTPGRLPVRAGSPWHAAQPSDEVSGRPFRCPPPARLMVPLALTGAVTGAGTAMWPVGGVPGQESQASGAVAVQVTVAREPVMPLKSKLPW